MKYEGQAGMERRRLGADDSIVRAGREAGMLLSLRVTMMIRYDGKGRARNFLDLPMTSSLDLLRHVCTSAVYYMAWHSA